MVHASPSFVEAGYGQFFVVGAIQMWLQWDTEKMRDSNVGPPVLHGRRPREEQAET